MSEVVIAPQTLLSFIERAARDENFSVEKFGELLRLQREAEQDLARRAFNRAMAEAQSEMMPVIRSAQNKHLGNKYAKLEDIDREMRPIYTRHGFSVRFGSAPAPREGDIRITCTVAHDGGYYEENYLDAPASLVGSQGGRMAVTPVQAVGSVVSYLRRYLETMVFNVVLADDDDDGEGTRRAAAATPRAERKVDPKVYEAPPRSTDPQERTDAQWRLWLDKLRDACATLYHRSEVVQVAERPSVADALASGPEWVQREISSILAENYNRFAVEVPEEELPEVEIAGADKVAAGD
jgi:hypothetical protein